MQTPKTSTTMANQIAKDILAAIDNLKTLEIKTIIGEIDRDSNNNIVAVAGNSDAIETQIDMIDGDITTAMSDKFLTDPNYAPLRDFHANREKEGHKIIKDNIEALKSLVGLFDTVKTKSEEGDDGETG